MKYAHLQQIAKHFKNFKKITSVKRVGDMILLIYFDKNGYFFDLSKADSAIYANDEFKPIKEYNAPFDIALKKRLNNAKITNIECQENNRILVIWAELSGSYKSVKSRLYLEFTGRFTNAILTDENGVIIDALRHIQNDLRSVKPGKELVELEAIAIKEKAVESISDFDEFFRSEFKKLNEKNLQNLKNIKISLIDKKIEALSESLNSLENEEQLTKEAEILRKKATLLLSNLANLNDYDREFELVDFDNKKVKFSLNLSPKDSTNELFNRAKKLIQKANNIDIQRQNLLQKLKFHNSLKTLLNNALSTDELEVIYPKRKNQSKNQKNENENVQSFYIGECKISIGKNEKGNAELLKSAKKDDIWMHIKDIPSAHVIIKSNKTKLSDEILNFAARICLDMSVSGAGRYEIDYTKRQNVKISSGASVNYIDFKTILLSKDQS